MSFEIWGIYLSAVILLCLTPGPNSLLAVTNGLRYGVRKTLLSTLGCASGLAALIGLSLSGLGLVLAASQAAFEIIRWSGAVYLIYLGVRLIRSEPAPGSIDAEVGNIAPRRDVGLYIQGLLIVLMNPKVLIFFVAFLPQFYWPSEPFWQQFVVLTGTFVVVQIAVEVALAVFASKISGVMRSYRGRRIFDRVTGSTFALAGLYLVTLERPR